MTYRRDDNRVATPLGLLKVFEIVVGIVCMGLILGVVLIFSEVAETGMRKMFSSEFFYFLITISFLSFSFLSLITNMLFRATNELVFNIVACLLFFAAVIYLAIDAAALGQIKNNENQIEHKNMTKTRYTMDAAACGFGAVDAVLYGVGAFMSWQDK